ncbi:MAG: OmpA family protein [Pseudomonadota bacterium]
MTTFLKSALACLALIWPVAGYAQASSGYVPPDMFGDPDAQESVSETTLPPLPAPPPPAAPIVVQAPRPAPPPEQRPATRPLTDALNGIDNKAPPPPMPVLKTEGATNLVPKPDMTPMALTPTPAKAVEKPAEKPPEKPIEKQVEKPKPAAPVEPAMAVPVAPVIKEPVVPQPVAIAPPAAPIVSPPPLARPAPSATVPTQIISSTGQPIEIPDIAPPRVDTSTSKDLAAQLIFAPGAADMVPNQKTVLAQDIIVGLQQDPTSRLQIVAYATAVDEGMSSARRVSLNRALGIRDHLKAEGVAPERIDVRAMGSETNASPVDRVDLLLIPAR